MNKQLGLQAFGIALMLASQAAAVSILDWWSNPNLWFPFSITVFALIFPIIGSALAMAGALTIILFSALLLPLSIANLTDMAPWISPIMMFIAGLYFIGARIVYQSARKPSWWTEHHQTELRTSIIPYRLRKYDYLLIGIAVVTVLVYLLVLWHGGN